MVVIRMANWSVRGCKVRKRALKVQAGMLRPGSLGCPAYLYSFTTHSLADYQMKCNKLTALSIFWNQLPCCFAVFEGPPANAGPASRYDTDAMAWSRMSAARSICSAVVVKGGTKRSTEPRRRMLTIRPFSSSIRPICWP